MECILNSAQRMNDLFNQKTMRHVPICNNEVKKYEKLLQYWGNESQSHGSLKKSMDFTRLNKIPKV